MKTTSRSTKKRRTQPSRTVCAAVQKIRAEMFQGLLKSWDMEQLASSLAGEKVYGGEYRILIDSEDVWDRKPCRATVAQFCRLRGYALCAAALQFMRAEEFMPPAVVTTSKYHMVLQVPHPEGKGYAWIDCETGKVELSAHWPRQQAERGERRFVLPPKDKYATPYTPPKGYTPEMLAQGRKLNARWSALFDATYNFDSDSVLYQALERRMARMKEALAALKRAAKNEHALVLNAGGVR